MKTSFKITLVLTAISISAILLLCASTPTRSLANSAACSPAIQVAAAPLIAETFRVELNEAPHIRPGSPRALLEPIRHDILKLKADQESFVAKYGSVNCLLTNADGTTSVLDTIGAESEELDQELALIDSLENELGSVNDGSPS